MKNLLLAILALAAKYFAAQPSDRTGIAALHQEREKLLNDHNVPDDQKDHISSFLRVAETALPTADATATAERLTQAAEQGKQGEEKQSATATQPPSSEPSGNQQGRDAGSAETDGEEDEGDEEPQEGGDDDRPRSTE